MKVKKITMEMLMVAILMIACIVIFPNNVNAAVSYTRTITSNDGSIEINLAGLTLDEEKDYSFALVTRGKIPETWHSIVTHTTNTAKINLGSATSDIRDVLKKTDTGYIYVKDNSAQEGTYVVDKLEVNLKLPLLQAISYDTSYSNIYVINDLYKSINNKYYQFVKVTDKNFIHEYLKIKNSNGDISTLESSLPSIPDTGYTRGAYPSSSEKNDGLYLLWVKLTGNDTKEVFGCIIHDGLPDATKVEDYIEYGTDVKSIEVISPASGTYKAPQTVKILVRFDGKIKGSTVPTLKIKFGESQERSLTNGTIQNDYYVLSEDGVIIYSYNIQVGDEGQLAAVSLTGGNITDEKGNEAKLSCPLITGNTIKANTEGQVNNQTENQDKNNTDKTPSTNNNQGTGTGSGSTGTQNGGTTGGTTTGTGNGSNGSGTTNKPSGTTTNNNNSNGKDDTTVKEKLPQTGVNEGIIAVIAVIAVIGGVMYVRYRKMKDII